ncbi:magnesium transporter [Arhodomonas sp. SL1]|uniref:magnesium transporter n=1 Tax=Arhodomonas sp. SL1 TaxID=3425691 RepID=UPI003F882050
MSEPATQLESWTGAIAAALDAGDTATAAELAAQRHPAELADILEALPGEARLALWRLLPDPEVRGEVLIEARREVRDRLIEATRSTELAEAVSHLELDELADLYDKLPRKVVRALIRTMDLQRRQRLRRVLSYPEDTAGGLMDADALAVREDITLETAQRYLRRVRKKEGALPEHITALFVIDRENRFRGLLPLDELVAQPQSALVGETMDHEFRAIPADTPARQVARLFEDRDLTTAPVVDPEGRLIGRITVDDVVDVIRDEGERSLMQSAGLNRNEDMFAPVLATAARRGVWLGANLVNAFIASWVIGLFGATIEERVALAILMPIVASMGGVAGIQTLTLVVRGIALDQIGRANGLRLLGHEFRVALVLGLALALILGAAALVWFRDPTLALVFGAAVVINLANAAFSGTLVPLALERAGIDPALAGGMLLTALTDILGFASFLGLAAWILV